MLGYLLHIPRGSFYSPKGPNSCWSSIWKALVAFCPWVHRTIRCTPDTAQCNDYESLIGWFPLLGGTGLSGAPNDYWPCANVSSSRWLAGTPDYPALHADCLMIYSRWWLILVESSPFSQTVHSTILWVALDQVWCYADQSNFSFLIPNLVCSFWLDFIKSLALRQIWLVPKTID
jgi:hypothetical protein